MRFPRFALENVQRIAVEQRAIREIEQMQQRLRVNPPIQRDQKHVFALQNHAQQLLAHAALQQHAQQRQHRDAPLQVRQIHVLQQRRAQRRQRGAQRRFQQRQRVNRKNRPILASSPRNYVKKASRGR